MSSPVEPSAGSLIEWSIQDIVGVTSPPTVVDGVAHFGDWTGNVYAVDAATGDHARCCKGYGRALFGSPGEGGLIAFTTEGT